MGVYFTGQGGKKGMLDVAIFLRDQGYMPTRVEDGNIYFVSDDGQQGLFSIADWAVSNGYHVDKIDGFNTPITAIDMPPENMTALDQSVFYMDGKRTDALREIFAQVYDLDDGRTVVLDNDGLWKTMWSDNWSPPPAFPTFKEQVDKGNALDPRTGMRAAAIALLFGLTGVKPKISDRNIKINDIVQMIRVLSRNVPMEGKIILGKFVEQTTGLSKWKFSTVMSNVNELESWLPQVLKMSSFEFRMKQVQMADLLVVALHEIAVKEFRTQMKVLAKMPETKNLVCNMKEVIDDFLGMLTNMDVIRDMSKITGLEEWKNMAKDKLVNERNLPPMPEFVPKLVMLLRWVLPITKSKSLAIAKGKRGLDAIQSLMVMLDSTIFSLRDVPDSTAKQKMFMSLKNFQAKLEGKLAYYYHPHEDKTGIKVNFFMEAKAMYVEKREAVYKIIQLTKEEWVRHLLTTFRKEPNIDAFYDILPKDFAAIVQSFIAMDTAYDLQSWIDGDYKKRTNDPFAMTNKTYGAPPPEMGILANNSPRAAYNIIETLIKAAGMFMDMEDKERKAVLRTPLLMSNVFRMIKTSSVNREQGAADILNEMGIADPYSSPDPRRIWEDPAKVDLDYRVQSSQVAAQVQSDMEGQMMQQQQQPQAPMNDQQKIQMLMQKFHGDASDMMSASGGGGAPTPQGGEEGGGGQMPPMPMGA